MFERKSSSHLKVSVHCFVSPKRKERCWLHAPNRVSHRCFWSSSAQHLRPQPPSGLSEQPLRSLTSVNPLWPHHSKVVQLSCLSFAYITLPACQFKSWRDNSEEGLLSATGDVLSCFELNLRGLSCLWFVFPTYEICSSTFYLFGHEHLAHLQLVTCFELLSVGSSWFSERIKTTAHTESLIFFSPWETK